MRVISYALLFMIAYGAMAEMAHSHSHVSPDRSDVTYISDAGNSHSSDTGQSHTAECPVCQFQQQLFNGVIHVPSFALAPSTEIVFISTPAVFHSGASPSTPSGRGPPIVRG
jgi:hypothetical protein